MSQDKRKAQRRDWAVLSTINHASYKRITLYGVVRKDWPERLEELAEEGHLKIYRTNPSVFLQRYQKRLTMVTITPRGEAYLRRLVKIYGNKTPRQLREQRVSFAGWLLELAGMRRRNEDPRGMMRR